MMDPEQRIWGFETNFGGLAEIALVKSNQLMPKPDHLTWEEAASPGLVNSTAYRQLVSRNGAGMKQGDNVLIWGASGGLGGFATQYALNGGAVPVCVVSSEEKADDLPADGRRADHQPVGGRIPVLEGRATQDPKEWRRFGSDIRELTGGEDVDIVFEHPGRETFGASVYAARKGGTIVTCASTSRLHARVRQPLPLDEPQADHRLPLRQLPRVVGGQPADREGDDPPDPLAHLSARPRSVRPRSTCTTTSTRARSACSAWPRRRAWACATRRSGPGTSTRSTPSATSEPQPPQTHGRGHSPAAPGEPGWWSFHDIGHTEATSRSGKGMSYMSDEGLSIFDDEPENQSTADEQPTQVIKAQGGTAKAAQAHRATPPADEGDRAARRDPEGPDESRPPRRRSHRRAGRSPAPTRQPQAPQRRPASRPSRGRRRRPAPAAVQSAGGGTLRHGAPRRLRQGRGRRHLRQVQPEKAGPAPAPEPVRAAGRRAGGQLETARTELAENANPSYAGLGGRASAMLRLAEEEAAEIRASGASDAEDIRGQALRDATSDPRRGHPGGRRHAAGPAQGAGRDAGPDHRRRRAGAVAGDGRGRGPAGRRQARVRAAPAGRRAGDQGARGQRHPRGGAGPCRAPTARCRRPVVPWRSRRSGSPRRRPTTTPAPPPRPVAWSRRPSSGPTPPRREPRAATAQANTHRQQAQSEAEALLSRARREAEQIVASARTQADAITASGNAEHERQPGRPQGRGRPDDQATRGDLGPARVAARA